MIQEKIFDMKGKTVLVTGASSGIGESLSTLFAQAGSSLAIIARREERINNLADEIQQQYGVKCLAIPCDIQNEENVVQAIQQVFDTYGRIDVLINNAGITEKSEDITTFSWDQWNHVIDINLRGTYCVSREVARGMKLQNYGKIINIASVCGMLGVGNQLGYVASKSGIIGLTRAMAVELGKYNITVNAISPGYVLTEMTNPQSSGCRYFRSRSVLNTIGSTDDLFGTALLLASDASRYMSGVIIPVDGGITANL
ncbi:MAG: SDR family oxidoreductase [Oscillospiraceae bacterium]|nr:SDR family oxidoreductase [Oscillospiraceae bacterium]